MHATSDFGLHVKVARIKVQHRAVVLFFKVLCYIFGNVRFLTCIFRYSEQQDQLNGLHSNEIL